VYPTRPGRLYLMWAAGALLLLLFAQQQQVIALPVSGRVGRAVPDALHGTWFACVTWFVLSIVGSRFRPRIAVALTALIGLAIAVGTELLQVLTGGDAEIGDVLFDLIGMSAALLVWSAREKLINFRTGVALATMLMLGSLWPVAMPIVIDHYRDSIVPQLVRFDSPYMFDLVHSGSVVAVVDPPAGWPIEGRALKVTLADERWPGVWFPDPISNWRAYSELDADVFVDGTSPMPITISIRLSGADVDNVYQAFECAPGPCRLRFKFDGLFDRSVARVTMVVVFSQRSQAGRTFYLGRIELHE
jgi:hypothetical protein